MINAKKSQFHIDNNFEFCTIDYFSRPKTLNQYAFMNEEKKLTYNPHL